MHQRALEHRRDLSRPHAAESSSAPASALLDGIAHELRTPLNAICGFVELALAGDLGPVSGSLREALEHIARSGRSLESTIDTVVACRHVLPGDEPPALPVDLAAALEQAGFEVVAAPNRAWPTVMAAPERFVAGLAAARRWLARDGRPAGRPRATLERGAAGSCCRIEPIGAGQRDEGLGRLERDLARVLLGAAGVALSGDGRSWRLTWPASAESFSPQANVA
jgi:His Kinase A (phospho-acceptor) domain